jgi:hypothetical protein
MTIPITFFIVLTGCAVAWWGAKTYERMKHAGRIRDLESKIRLAQGETFQLREQVSLLKGEVSVLHKTITEERVSKQTALTAMTESFKRGMLTVGMMAMAAGIAVGGGVSWQAATWRVEAQKAGLHYETELQNRLNALKVEYLEKQLNRYEKEMDRYRIGWQEEQVEKAVAQTKLEIIMNSLAPQKGIEGFALDYKKMKDSLKQNPEKGIVAEDLALLKQTFRP